MKISIAMDSFKGSLSSAQACDSVERGIRRVLPDCCIIKVPIADGGEGTVDALSEKFEYAAVHDPLGRLINARYGLRHKTAVIEMSAASGLCLLSDSERDPRITSTRGTGELVLAALDKGIRDILIGIGGSATNDGGMGFAKALGIRFLDSSGAELPEGGASLIRLSKIDLSGLDKRLAETRVRVACDVDNPLCGKNGASEVFGPQKGASVETVAELDKALYHYGTVIERETGKKITECKGAGAAGGLGAALMTFLPGCILSPGIKLVLEAVHAKEKFENSDIIITGEGRTDFQTCYGKAPAGVAALRGNARVFILSGSLGKGYENVFNYGITSAFSIADGPMNLSESMEKAPQLLENAAFRLIRALIPEV